VTNSPQAGRAREYLAAEAAKPFAELREPVEAARAALLAEAEALTEAQAVFKPASGSGEDAWSAHQVLRHVIQGIEGNALRVRALGLGDAARGSTPGRLVGRADASLADLVRDLKAAYFALDHAVGSVEGKERLDTTATHALFGELNCREWFLFQRIHDGDHTRQLQKLKADPAFPGASS
jgi:hypothetical protein